MSRALSAIGWGVLIVTGLFALYILLVGLSFGFALWDADNPKPTLMWFGVLIAPGLAAIGLRQRQRSPAVLLFALIAACALPGTWIISAFTV